MQFIPFFFSTVIDNVNILKINVKLKHLLQLLLRKFSISYFMHTYNFDIDYLRL